MEMGAWLGGVWSSVAVSDGVSAGGRGAAEGKAGVVLAAEGVVA